MKGVSFVASVLAAGFLSAYGALLVAGFPLRILWENAGIGVLIKGTALGVLPVFAVAWGISGVRKLMHTVRRRSSEAEERSLAGR